jgi:hypothetical protein
VARVARQPPAGFWSKTWARRALAAERRNYVPVCPVGARARLARYTRLDRAFGLPEAT